MGKSLEDYMADLPTYSSSLSNYSKRLKDWQSGKAYNVYKAKNVNQVVRAVSEPIILANTIPITAKPAARELIIESLVGKAKIYNIPTLDEIKRQVDAANRTGNDIHSSQNPVMLWSRAQALSMGAEISSNDEGIAWFDFLTPISQDALVSVWGDKPIDCSCKSCKRGETDELYPGRAPTNLDEVASLRHIVRKMPGIPREALSHSLNWVEWCLEDGSALSAMKNKYNFAGYRAWFAGELAFAMQRGVPV